MDERPPICFMYTSISVSCRFQQTSCFYSCQTSLRWVPSVRHKHPDLLIVGNLVLNRGEVSCDERGNLSQLPIPPNTNSFSKGELLTLSRNHQNTSKYSLEVFSASLPLKMVRAPKGSRIVFQPSFFRGELLNFGDVCRRKQLRCVATTACP